jgi:hypothetical protein
VLTWSNFHCHGGCPTSFPQIGYRRSQTTHCQDREQKTRREKSFINSEEEYEVEEIVSSKTDRGRLMYQAQWRGWDPDPEWYPASNFKNAAMNSKSTMTATRRQPDLHGDCKIGSRRRQMTRSPQFMTTTTFRCKRVQGRLKGGNERGRWFNIVCAHHIFFFSFFKDSRRVFLDEGVM